MKQSFMTNLKFSLFLFTILLIASCNQSSKENIRKQLAPSLFNKMSKVEFLKLTIQTDFKLLFENKEIEGKHFQPASLNVKNKEAIIYEGKLKVRPRGITRRSNCSFPPIMLKTVKEELGNHNLGPSFNIKLVAHCEDSMLYDQWVLKEYLVYKMLNFLSKESFEVKKVEATYEDTNNNIPTITKMGFLIEPLEELSNRCDCPLLDDQTAIKSIHKEHYKLITFFQFMVGNTDWNLSRRHNIRLLNCNPEYGPTPVPYDFDYSGFVNAAYAKPHPMLPIKNVTDRLLQWRGDINEDFSNTVATFNTHKSAFISLIQKELNLSEEARTSSLLYLDEFYNIISSPDLIKKEIEKARSK